MSKPGGVYTETNPDCAKGCVAKGSKIVLIVPDEKTIFGVENRGIAKKHVGDYVEVSGKAQTLLASPMASFNLREALRGAVAEP